MNAARHSNTSPGKGAAAGLTSLSASSLLLPLRKGVESGLINTANLLIYLAERPTGEPNCRAILRQLPAAHIHGS